MNLVVGERADIGDVLVRATIPTINTHLDGDYHADDDVMAILAERFGTDVESLRRTTSLTFNWEIRAGVTDVLQGWFIDLGQQAVAHLPEDRIVDRSFYGRAVGHEL